MLEEASGIVVTDRREYCTCRFYRKASLLLAAALRTRCFFEKKPDTVR
jgi:hypothetical protein